jgi:hypothetical protein
MRFFPVAVAILTQSEARSGCNLIGECALFGLYEAGGRSTVQR